MIIVELATLYKQCPGDREIEEYIRRIHSLRQRMMEANIHVKIIEVEIQATHISSICRVYLGSCRQNGTVNSKNENINVVIVTYKYINDEHVRNEDDQWQCCYSICNEFYR
jgi:hypothetical protein